MPNNSRRFSITLCTLLALLGNTSLEAAEPAKLGQIKKHRNKGRQKYHSPASQGRKHHTYGKYRKKKWNPVATPDDPYGDEAEMKVYDPLEKINRGTFAFNSVFYKYIGKPLAKFTDFLIPAPVMTAANNVFDNVESPVRIASSLLQGKGQRALQETGKLLVNSTVGIGGLWKPSDRIESLKKVPSEDVGQTLGVWGVPAGPYLVLPVLGPSSARDLTGRVGDTCLTPTTWLGTSKFRTITRASKAVVENPDRMDTYDATTQDALDKYIALREAYTSYRNGAIER